MLPTNSQEQIEPAPSRMRQPVSRVRLVRRFMSPSRIRHYGHHGSAWILGSLLIGLIAVGLATASEYAIGFNRALTRAAPFAALLLTPAGFALCAWLARHYFGGTQGSGIPQTIAAINSSEPGKKSTLLSLRIAFGKVMLAVMGLAAGASTGREGPTVQIGASIMHSFYGRGPFRSVTARRKLILAGGAAGIAAAFNTPLAGIMFAIEELSKEHVFNANSSVLITVIMSGLISLALLESVMNCLRGRAAPRTGRMQGAATRRSGAAPACPGWRRPDRNPTG